MEQVKSARPSLDYNGRYGIADGFIDAVYRQFNPN
jgi:hypothetical protein